MDCQMYIRNEIKMIPNKDDVHQSNGFYEDKLFDVVAICRFDIFASEKKTFSSMSHNFDHQKRY